MIVHNVTPDSFYPPSRYDESVFVSGADIVDIGGCSTRPGAVPVTEEQEWARLEPVLRKLVPSTSAPRSRPANHPGVLPLPHPDCPGGAIFCHADYPGAAPFALSIDTFRPSVVRRAAGLLARAFIVNDVGGPSTPCPSPSGSPSRVAEMAALCPPPSRSLARVAEMAALCREFGLFYVATHNGPACDTFKWFESAVPLLEGVNWILDPGLGFGKDDPQENWDLLSRLGDFKCFGRPILVGASRKRFVNGSAELTRKANRLAADGGATIFRVHDIADAAF